MQPGVADGLAEDDPIGGPIRRRPVEGLESNFGAVEAPRARPALSARSALVSVSTPHSNHIAIDAAALDRLPLRDDPRAGFSLGRVRLMSPLRL
jgi:hypothetical protein